MPGGFMLSGAWIIFPIIGIVIMAGFMFVMMNRGGGGFWPRSDDRGHSPRRDHHEPAESETPLSILKKRYAKGEISKEEYDEMKAEL